jgi:hypothetical protein
MYTGQSGLSTEFEMVMKPDYIKGISRFQYNVSLPIIMQRKNR